MISLVGSIIALLIGPLLYLASERRREIIRLLDGFVFFSISGLLLIHFVSSIESHNAFLGIVFILLGLLGPTALELLFKKAHAKVHIAGIFLGIIGLLFHGLLDGAALSEAEHSLPLAIILHRVPVGLTLWWVVAPNFGSRTGWITICLLCLATVFGFSIGESIFAFGGGAFSAYLQAFIAGAILHVVFFPFHLEEEEASDCCCASTAAPKQKYSFPEFFGNILGLLVILTVVISHSGLDDLHTGHELHLLEQIAGAFYSLALVSAPALFLAYLLSGIVYAFTPSHSVKWISSGSQTAQATKGVIVGLPLPVCSCGILPFYETLIKRGTAPAAAMAFLIATPELGLDAILISFPLLGGEFTIIRLVCAALLAFIVARTVSSFMSSSQEIIEDEKTEPFKDRLANGLKFGLVDLVDHTGPWIVVGLAMAAFAQPLLLEYPLGFNQFLEVIIFSVIGIVVYVCASGATPLAAVLILGGLSPGAALAFLLTGPATNISTFGVIARLHNKRIALYFAIAATLTAIILGTLVNYFFSDSGPTALLDHHHDRVAWWRIAALWGTALIFLYSIMRRGARGFFSEVLSGNR